jgi:hypothetical protein
MEDTMMRRLLLSFSIVMILAGGPGIPIGGHSAPVGLTAMETIGAPDGPQVKRPAGRPVNPQGKVRIPVRGDIRLRKGAAPARTTWVRTYSREETLTLSGVGVIYGYRMAPANDGGFFLLGHTSVDIPASYDSCVLKVDPAGSIEWQRILRQGPGAGNTQFLHSISPTSDGGCVAGGVCDSGVMAMKFEADGDVAWRRSFDREDAREEFADLRQTSDGGYVLLASSGLEDTMGIVNDKDVLLIKLDPLGIPVWQRTYGSPFQERAAGVVELADGGFALCGGAPSLPSEERESLVILRLTASGDIVWQTVYQGWEAPVFSLERALDGGLILAGYAFEDASQFRWDAWAMKLAAGGAVEWTKTYHGDHEDSFFSITTTLDGGYLAAGSSDSFSSHGDQALLVRLSSNGDVEWQRTYGREDHPEDGYSSGRSAFPAPDGSLYLAGTTSFGGMGGIRFLLIKASAEGLVGRLPGFVADAGLEVRDSTVEALPAALVSQDVPVVSSIPELTPLDVAIRGGLLFAPPLNAAGVRTSSRSLALLGRSNVLTWEPNPANDDLEIVKYRIYAVGPIPPSNGDLIVLPDDAFHLYEVDGGAYRFAHSPLKAGGYYYMIWGVGADGGEGLAVLLTQLDAGRRP